MRIGYYYRWAMDIDLQSYKIIIIRIPVARYLCKAVSKPQHKHGTFSLLPDTLIPYNRISIDLMMYILQLLITTESGSRTLQKIDPLTPGDIFFSEKMLVHLLEIMAQIRIKLILFFQQYSSDRAPPDFHAFTLHEVVDYLYNYPVPDHEHPLKGAYSLSVLYYEMQESYHQNARFLFGTASQFCL